MAIFQTNSANLDETIRFFNELGLEVDTAECLDRPASGKGRLVKIHVEGFNPFGLRAEIRRRWLALSQNLEVTK